MESKVKKSKPLTKEDVWEGFDELRKIMKESQEKSDREWEIVRKKMGAWADNHGSFAEEYFFNSFERGEKTFFGEKFDYIAKKVKNHWKGLQAEYDIVIYNCTSVAIIEVKFKAHINDLQKVLQKAQTFKILFPNYKDFKIYIGLASMTFYDDLEQACKDNGIAIIKQVGDNVVVYDEHLKIF